jgi:class 3 adenylate cyclase
MTETLGADIIHLLNLHYDKAIHHIHERFGDIGSIIGDALLAVYGHMQDTDSNKSLMAIQSAYGIQDVAADLRRDMHKRREEIIEQRGSLTEAEERVYEAVLIEVGVGIDGGEVFYGNIGSYERMVNTVIGDNVNSASRLEGLTRLYKVPVIVSEFVKNEVEADTADYIFLELDTVQVKGKTIGRQVYWPVLRENVDEDMQADIDRFSEALQSYYDGDWKKAHTIFKKCNLACAEVFRRRTKDNTAPKGWNGIWAMKEK